MSLPSVAVISLSRVGCILCGFAIYDPTESGPGSWLREFRAIYSGPSGTFVSGIGCRDDNESSEWIAPSDPTVRWDDENSSFTETLEVPVMSVYPSNGIHGFVLHDACWHLLQKAFQLGDIPLKRLLEICESLPFPLAINRACWGHDYGNLFVLYNEDRYPWEDQRMENFHAKTRLYAKENPYDVPEIPPLLLMRAEHPPECLPKTPQDDCFSRLPWEILEAIAIELLTDDALSLRCVSKAFLPLLSSNSFWASRFEPNGERGFVFEKRRSRDATNWRGLYRLTSQAHSPPGLRNRRRIWNLIRPLIDLIGLRLAEGSKVTNIDPKSTCLRWVKVTGDVRDEAPDGYPRNFNECCRLFGIHFAQMPKDLLKMSFSISSIGNATYIAGIRLITEKGPDICLGFISEGKEVIREATALKGFVLATGSRGIHALRVVSKDTSISEWVGCSDNTPITERLASFDFIAALEVGFDGYKLVSLGVLGDFSPPIQASKVQDSSLREVALWYPKVPGPELCLNEKSFTGENPSSTGYQPLFWIHFGGPSGSNLGHVTGVSVDYLKRLYTLEFHYDTTSSPAGAYKLGRTKYADVLKTLEFPIDGTGGELIETVEVSLERYEEKNAYSFLKHGKLSSIKITTNRKRSFHVGTLAGDATLQPIVIAPGTTLTGFYASQHKEFGLISLGAISEAINNISEVNLVDTYS